MTLGRIKPKGSRETSGLLSPSVETLEKLNTQTLGVGPELRFVLVQRQWSSEHRLPNTFKAFPLIVLSTESVQNKY